MIAAQDTIQPHGSPDKAGAAPVLSVRDLCVAFGNARRRIEAVRRVTFDLFPGRTLALVGESGSGKSVTSLALMRLIAPAIGGISGGSAILDIAGERLDLVSLPESRVRRLRGRHMAMIFQEPMTSLNPVLTIGEQIGEVLRTHMGASRAEARKTAIGLLDRVGIGRAADRIDSYPHEFSGGMRQRVMIAIALACKPSVMIADEPTTALDVTVQAQILLLMRDLQKETGMALLFITHNLGVVANIADETAVMYAGELMEVGATRDLLRRPVHPYTQGLLASLPPEIDAPFDRDRQPLTPIVGNVVSLSSLPQGCTFAPRCPIALDACSERPIPMLDTAQGRLARCIRIGEAS